MAAVINDVFLERGLVRGVLINNGTAFRSAMTKGMLDW